MRLIVTRDSVGPGDDVEAPHRVEMHAAEETTPSEVVSMIARSTYLPLVVGGHATRSVVSNRPIAVIAQQWNEARMVSAIPVHMESLRYEGDALRVHVNCHAQQDPEAVLEVLGRLSIEGFWG